MKANDHKNHVGCLSKSIKKADQDLQNIRFYSLVSPTEKQSTLAGLPSRRCMKKAPFTVIHEKPRSQNHVGCLSKSFKKADQDLKNIRFYSLGSPTEKQSTLAGLPSRRCMKKAPFTVIHEKPMIIKPCWMSLEVFQKSRSGPQKHPVL